MFQIKIKHRGKDLWATKHFYNMSSTYHLQWEIFLFHQVFNIFVIILQKIRIEMSEANHQNFALVRTLAKVPHSVNPNQMWLDSA